MPLFKRFNFVLFLLLFTSSCFYYKISKVNNNYENLQQLKQANKYFILHYDTNAVHLNNLSLNLENQILSGKIETLPWNHKLYIFSKNDKPNRYNSLEGEPIGEIHLYTNNYKLDSQNIEIAFPSITQIEKYDIDSKAVLKSWIIGCSSTSLLLGAASIGLFVLWARSL